MGDGEAQPLDATRDADEAEARHSLARPRPRPGRMQRANDPRVSGDSWRPRHDVGTGSGPVISNDELVHSDEAGGERGGGLSGSGSSERETAGS